ncbi:fimbria major subunit [Bacteroides sp.]
MKLRSLFLASLAAIAMASCSNENDQIIDNGVNEGNALMQFAISAPETRATTPSAGEAEEGTAAENGFSNIVIVLKYTTSQTVLNLPADKFKKEGQMLYMITPEIVPAGSATTYVFVNGTEDGKDADYTNLFYEASYTNSYDIIAIAQDNNFLMANDQDIKTLDFTEGQTTSATVAVNRVVAKLEEKTPATPYSVDIKATDVDGNEIDYQGKTLSIKFANYAYTDLNQKTNLLVAGTTSANLFQPFETSKSFIYKTIGTADTYCLENPNAVSIVYKAKALWDGVEATESFYTVNGKLYMNYAELLAEYHALPYDDEGTIEQFNSIGINKFEKGFCYYRAIIENANGSQNIVRNNIYRLSVGSVSNLGTTGPGGNGDKLAFLKLDVQINKWTVNLNSFAF